uniref:BRCA1 associated RING domain 1 n=1 Tax=Anolis carolinensis TaxID=28377 RepID=G1KR46_ANOCA|nr:PREDICTED: BRCA1-associated RING domain protein 1 [Anolis carolinensis]|eukprot:XP_008111738.1 PREDICTED: BRCA1-associated RING domain protein 1 [Anolis carolinensis]
MRPSALRVRSGNQACSSFSFSSPARMEQPWKETRAALGRLRESLGCSRCGGILKKPVNIGSCEHIFCLTCVGDSIGTACPVCHMPAMVQDMKVNRQLDNIIKLYSKLQNLQGPDFSDSRDILSTPEEIPSVPGTKKEIKMWFSPRSRKMRFTLARKPQKSETVMEKASQPHALTSTYDFISSPSSQETFREVKKRQPKKKKQRKKTLDDVNEQWGLLGGRKKDSSSETRETLVSFCSQSMVIPSPDSKGTSEQRPVMVESEGELGLSVSTSVITTPKRDKNKSSGLNDLTEECLASKECLSSGNSANKRDRQLVGSPTPLPKRHRKKEQNVSGRSLSLKELQGPSPQNLSGNTSPTFDSVMSSQLSVNLRNTEDFQRASSETFPRTPLKFNNVAQKGTQQTEPLCKKSPSNSSLKRNHKGETLLHVASIEGDLSSVEHLLKNGADPNVKDYAGWTPLHEACNHGHQDIVALLLQHGALLNATGYQNDLPLHDAVKNGHLSIVKLLLSHGASPDTVNIFGHRPVDYAETEEMKSVLILSAKNECSVTQSGEQINRNHPREGPVVLLGSGLDPAKRQLLSKLALVLKGSVCMEFNSTVTHVVIPDHPVRSTMKCMLAILNGCWILAFKWVEVCLQTGAREEEETYEIDGGPRQSRLNKEQLLPKLFDGCYFYFLGVFKEHNKDDLKELVKAGGGQILLRKPKSDNDVTQTINTVAYHAEITSDQSFCTQYIIYDGSSNYTPEKIRQGKVWEVPSKWLIECVMSFQLLPVKQ